MKRDSMVLWRELDARHKAALVRKAEKRGMLQALIEEYEQRGDFEYVRELKVRLRSVECQLKAMKP